MSRIASRRTHHALSLIWAIAVVALFTWWGTSLDNPTIPKWQAIIAGCALWFGFYVPVLLLQRFVRIEQ